MKSKKKLPLLFGTLAAGVVCLTMGVCVLGATSSPQTEIKQQTQIVQQSAENVGELRLLSADGTQSNGVLGEGVELTVSQWSFLNTYGASNSLQAMFTGLGAGNYTGTDIWTEIQYDVLFGSVDVHPVTLNLYDQNGQVYTASINVVDATEVVVNSANFSLTIGISSFTPNTPSGYICSWTFTNLATGNAVKSDNVVITGKFVQPINTTPSQSGTLTYNGSAQSPLQWNNYDSNKLTLNVTSQQNAGSYTAAFTPKTGYAWSDGTITAKSVNWSIGKFNLSNATIEDIPPQVVTGSAITPTPVVKTTFATLTAGTHFTCSYSNNTVIGTATVTITAVANTNYTGTKTANFTIKAATPWTTEGIYANGADTPTVDGTTIKYTAWAGYKWVWFGGDANFNGGTACTSAYDANAVRWIIIGGNTSGYGTGSTVNGANELVSGEILLFSEKTLGDANGNNMAWDSAYGYVWGSSTLYNYLNGAGSSDFIQTYLTDSNGNAIKTETKSLVSRDNKPSGGTEGGTACDNKVFLLAAGKNDLGTDAEQFVYSTYLGAKGSDNAKFCKFTGTSTNYYWLRSGAVGPRSDAIAHCVDASGGIHADFVEGYYSVRPAFVLHLD